MGNTKRSWSKAWLGVVLLAASSAACVNPKHRQAAKERNELHAEWMPWWQGDCDTFYDQFSPWLKKNKERAKKIEAAFEAIPMDKRDAAVKGLPDHDRFNQMEIEIMIKCGVSPSFSIQNLP